MRAFKRSSMLAVALVGLLAGSARAQDVMTANVPFPFVVNHTEFPAGRYDIHTGGIAEAVVLIEGMDNHSSAFELTIPAGGSDPAGHDPSLVFIRHGHEYRLTQIWESAAGGRELPASSGDLRSGRSESESGHGVVTYVRAANEK